MKKIQSFMCVLFSLLLSVLFVALPSTANAASSYDDYYHTTSSLRLHNDACIYSFDVSNNWKAYIQGSQYGSSFEVAENNGSQGVSLLPRYNVDGSGHSTATAVIAYWSESTQMSVEWMSWGYMVARTPSRSVILQLTGSGATCSVSVSDYGTGYISSNDGAVENYLFTGLPNYPGGYEGAALASQPPSPTYVPMGDSYSTGEGNPPFEYGTDVSDTNKCHRSLQAYPRLLQSTLSVGATAFVACSGAATSNITGSGLWNEPAQIDALTSAAERVTLTIGGNDVGFSDYIFGCIVLCGPGTPVYGAMMDGINSPAFKANLVYAYEQILIAAPNADLYVADYPHLSKSTTTACWGLDFSGAYNVQTALNGVIEGAVEEVQQSSSRIHLVKTNYVGSPFEGGELCDGSGTPLFTGLMSPREYSLHPNTQGQQAYASVFADAMS